jgi:hypothetical protein
MVKLEDVYGDKIEYQFLGDEASRQIVHYYRPLLERISCDHCGQAYSKEQLDLAVFLYGIFFLVGKDEGYVGCTCPSCIKTILMRGSIDLVLYTREIFLYSFLHNGSYNAIHLSYNSSIVYSLKHIPGISKFIYYQYSQSNKCTDPGYIEGPLCAYEDEHLPKDKTMFRSYIYGIDINSIPYHPYPSGPIFDVYWFAEDQIEDLVKLEQKTKLKIFPRYNYTNNLIEEIDIFCFDNWLSLKMS